MLYLIQTLCGQVVCVGGADVREKRERQRERETEREPEREEERERERSPYPWN